MLKKSIFLLTILMSLSILLLGCSSDPAKGSKDSAENKISKSDTLSNNEADTGSETEDKSTEEGENIESERMVIHQAELYLK